METNNAQAAPTTPIPDVHPYLEVMRAAGKLHRHDIRPMKAMRRERSGWTTLGDVKTDRLTSFFAQSVSEFAEVCLAHNFTRP